MAPRLGAAFKRWPQARQGQRDLPGLFVLRPHGSDLEVKVLS